MLNVSLPTVTIVLDGNTALLKFEGVLCLPVGSRIQIDNIDSEAEVPLDIERFPAGHADAVVMGIRVFGTQGGSASALILDVKLTDPGSQN